MPVSTRLRVGKEANPETYPNYARGVPNGIEVASTAKLLSDSDVCRLLMNAGDAGVVMFGVGMQVLRLALSLRAELLAGQGRSFALAQDDT
ncbi:MAG: hypothetical protein HKN43_08420 [Rhodothermales bacterium]|nr:hypothetical protein [Rhodothermales bacterium]